MICPSCSEDIEISVVTDGLGICPACLRSVVVGENRLATAADTAALSVEHLALLRKARAAARKNR